MTKKEIMKIMEEELERVKRTWPKRLEAILLTRTFMQMVRDKLKD